MTDMQTETLLARLDDMIIKIQTIHSLVATGHDLSPEELSEWCQAVQNHQILYRSMMIILANPELIH